MKRHLCFVFLFLLLLQTNAFSQDHFPKLKPGKANASANSMVLDSVLNSGGISTAPIKVFLDSGTFYFSKNIRVKSYTTLSGKKSANGSNLTILKWLGNENINNAIGYLNNYHYLLATSDQDNDITIKSITLDMDSVIASPNGSWGMGVYFNKCSDVVIDSVEVYNARHESIRVDDANRLGVRNVYIRNCKVNTPFNIAGIMVRSAFNTYNNQTPYMPSTTKNVFILNNKVTGSSHCIILLNVDSALVEGNHVINGYQRGIIGSPTCANIKIRKNIIEQCGSAGIHFAHFANNITIDSNTVSGTRYDGSGWGAEDGSEGNGIKLYYGYDHVIITNNKSSGNMTDGIALLAGQPGSRIRVENNICDDNFRDGIRIKSGYMLTRDDATGATGKTEGDVLEDFLVQFNSCKKNKHAGLFIDSNDSLFKTDSVTVNCNYLDSNTTNLVIGANVKNLTQIPCNPTADFSPSLDLYHATIFPNPFKQSFVLKIPSATVLNNTMLKIYDLYGREVKRTFISKHESSVSGDELKSGVYFYEIINHYEQIAVGKLICQ